MRKKNVRLECKTDADKIKLAIEQHKLNYGSSTNSIDFIISTDVPDPKKSKVISTTTLMINSNYGMDRFVILKDKHGEIVSRWKLKQHGWGEDTTYSVKERKAPIRTYLGVDEDGNLGYRTLTKEEL